MKHSETDGLSVRAAAIALHSGDCIERIDPEVGEDAGLAALVAAVEHGGCSMKYNAPHNAS